ncbi:MAG: PilZ domain-containing protein [Gammaproteobacteria bacterium]
MAAIIDTFSEKRTAVRYPVVFRVEFDNGKGWTRDVSTTGACIETDQKFECGAAVSFALNQKDPMDGMIRLQCSGIIVRTEQKGKSWRVAVFMEGVKFEG